MAIELAVEGLKSLTITPLTQSAFVAILYMVLNSLGSLVQFWIKMDRMQDENGLDQFREGSSYDFIVVGAGSAGGVVANRLSRSGYTVLLLEAGGDPNPLQSIPMFGLFLLNYGTDWMYRSVPQKYASLNSVNQQSSWSAGRGLGGTGNINLMIHLRGHRKDFDNWANITGDPSWSWEGVLPFFKSYEDYEVQGDNVNHGYGGDLRIESPDYISMDREFVRAGQEMGYPHVDLNAPFSEGFDRLRYPLRRGVRQAPYRAFIEPIKTLPSITILRFAHVNKILFRNGNEAFGVQFDRHGGTFTAVASREVILSAGAVSSPKILMLSGIGPRKHLEDLNIPLIQDLPVGHNLQDHIGVYLSPFLLDLPRSNLLERDITIGQFLKWSKFGTGRMTTTGCEATGIFSSQLAKIRGEGDWPDIQLFLFNFGLFRQLAEQLSQAFYLKVDEMRKYYQPLIGRDAAHVVISGARPFARGYVALGGSSPYDMPIIDPNYLGDPGGRDLIVLLEAVKKTLYLMENTTSFGHALGSKFTHVSLPGCEHLQFRSDSYWECFIRRFSVSLHHPVGTVSMGSVVDSELKVYGVKGLRVIDASVQPVLVVTNTQASTIMIGEKGAHMILRDWEPQRRSQRKVFYKQMEYHVANLLHHVID